MKKFMLFASALAGLFLAASCQKETLAPVGGNTVTYTVEAPGALQTKAIADGMNVNELIYEVWITSAKGTTNLNGAQKLYQGKADMFHEDGKNKAKVTLDLVNDQNYTVLFWAQVAGTGAYDTDELTAVTYAKAADEYLANDESLAAFYAVDFVNDGTAANPTVLLKRPFGQVNLCTLNERAPEKNPADYTIALVNSKMRLDAVPTTFNVATKEVTNYVAVDFAYNAVPSNPSTIKVNETEYYYAGMNYVFAGANLVLTYDIQTSLNGSTNYATVNNTISEVPVKANYRTNIVGNLLTSKTDYEIIVDAEFEAPDELIGEGVVLAKNSDELVAALKSNEAHLVIELVGAQTKAVTPVEFTVPVGAWTEKYYFGGDKTQDITINANGNKINFVHENGDWNYIRMVNENAKWIINDATLTNSGKNDGPWNRHDIRFYNAVELNNVTSDKAIALLNDGKLNNVTITEETGAYGLWITAEGQIVDINGLDITATNGGRGIAIKQEYVDAPACVTLNVANAKFTTASKAAVLVTSKAGAVINWGAGNDIKGVAADPINAVWVDEDYSQYDSEVKVEGASKVVEGAVDNVAANAANLSDVLAAAKESEATVVVNLAEGTYKFPALSGNVVLNCAEGTVFEGNSKANINGATVIGATFSNPSGTAVDQTINGTFKDCVFEGANALRWCYAGETAVFENCVFSGSTYGVHFDGGANDVLFKNCTFSGFNAFGAAVTMITFDGCTFVANGKSGYNGANLWGSAKMIDTEFIFDGNATYEWVDCLGADKTYEFTGCTINNGNFLNKTYVSAAGVIKVDGNDYDLNNSTFISTAEELFAFANEVNVNNNAFNGKTVYLVADIDLNNAAWTPVGQTGATTFNGVFDGQNHTISNLNVNSEAQTGEHYSSGLFGWVESHTAGHGHLKNVKIEGATINGHHNCGALVGYITQETALVENCHVTGATVTCTKANNDADGDKAGALIGNATVATPVNNCTAANSTVSAGRDAGQVIGAGKAANVTGCSATDVAVSANGTGTGANIRNEVIGRLL